jgi:tetratricopeptide (TPR) repeat protein
MKYRQAFTKTFAAGMILLLVIACSTEKNTFINRTYHGTTARYNGYFNANELLRLSLNSFRASLKENYYQTLPLQPLPDEKQVVGMYPAIDTAIVKCTKVIQKHCMPSNDRPSKKKEEHNPWIDENWTTIGIASFYRRDYDAAMKNFTFIKKFYSNDPSIFIAELWLARCYMEVNRLTDAGFSIATLQKAADEQDARAKEKPEKESKSSKKNKSEKEEEAPAEFPKSIRFEFEQVKAEYALRKNEPENAIKYLESSLKYAKKKQKARIHFIMAQLYESTGNREQAKAEYTQTLNYGAPYEMLFNARLRRAFMGGDEKVRKELLKMLRDAKNAEFKDQIYFALADIELQRQNKPTAIEYLTLSAFYSTTNTRQKGMAYEKLGDMSFAERNYVKAQKYYDSCGKVIDDSYPNAEGVRNKASNLADLVVAVETAQFEDSVQRIARMSEDDRKDFLKKVVKQIKDEEARRKRMEAERLRELQANQNTFAQTEGAGGKWYFNNAKTRTDGFNDFRKQWGTRNNEDDWRRSEKTVMLPTNNAIDDTLAPVVEKNPEVKADSLTPEMLLANIPLTDSALQASNNRLLEALYNAGVIYKEQLNERDLAKTQFNSVLDRHSTGIFDMSSAFQLYKMNEGNEAAAEVHKNYLITNYPNSDYANYLRDPDFFVKRKQREALAEQEYVAVLDRYNRGVYFPVISKANTVIEGDKDNIFRSKYMLLKAMAVGQTSENKEEIKPILNQLIAEYPGTDEAKRAQELLDILKNGYSANLPADFTKKSSFTFNDQSEQWVLVILGKDDNSTLSKTKVSDFNREFFSRDKLSVSSKIYGTDQSMILVQKFKDGDAAADYVRAFKATRKHLMDLQKARILIITQDNMKVLFEKQNLQEYMIFFDENY